MGNVNRTLTAVFSNTTAVAELSNESISLYPNPTSGIIYVKSNNLLTADLKEWHIVDALGRKILSLPLGGGAFPHSDINLSAFNEGIYFLEIITDKGEITKRIVLKH
jgi:hypothetical protein